MQNTLRYIRNMFGRADVWSHMCVVVTFSERKSAFFREIHTNFQNHFKPRLEALIDEEYENERTDPIRFFFVDSKVGQMDPESESELDQLIDFASSLKPMPTTRLAVPDPLIRKVTRYEETKTVAVQTAPRLIEVTLANGTVTHEPDGEVKTTVTETRFLVKREFIEAPDPKRPNEKCIVSEEREAERRTKAEIIGGTMLRKQYCMECTDRYRRTWTLVTWFNGKITLEDEQEERFVQPTRVEETDSAWTWRDTLEMIATVAKTVIEVAVPVVSLLTGGSD
ncbi:hypothetical protein BLNAU_12565 [Blattamonas nauphoetae]|uniref:AIG1-type G domain-containing protein n=1 Tax=Blattamonas nauphoetae TaxID=2049346 RepID=A0ABQ9XL44_9EUKA|nr:hypothetical protein BLNAU_12565 [Blattamonas nauphoetae]